MAADIDRLNDFAARVELIRANLSQRELAKFADQMAKEMRESNAKRIKDVTPGRGQDGPAQAAARQPRDKVHLHHQ